MTCNTISFSQVGFWALGGMIILASASSLVTTGMNGCSGNDNRVCYMLPITLIVFIAAALGGSRYIMTSRSSANNRVDAEMTEVISPPSLPSHEEEPPPYDSLPQSMAITVISLPSLPNHEEEPPSYDSLPQSMSYT